MRVTVDADVERTVECDVNKVYYIQASICLWNIVTAGFQLETHWILRSVWDLVRIYRQRDPKSSAPDTEVIESSDNL